MNWLMLAHVAFPILSALMTYSIEYGSKGMDHEDAIRDARHAFLGAAVLSLIILMVRLARGD